MEALDAAAVEAALSLCEEAVAGGHTLQGPWEPQGFKSLEAPGPSEPQQQQPITPTGPSAPSVQPPAALVASPSATPAMEASCPAPAEDERAMEVVGSQPPEGMMESSASEGGEDLSQGALVQDRGMDPGAASGAEEGVVGMEAQVKGEAEGEGMEEGQAEENRASTPTSVTVKQEREDWSQQESHTPCLGQLGTCLCAHQPTPKRGMCHAHTHTHTYINNAYMYV